MIDSAKSRSHAATTNVDARRQSTEPTAPSGSGAGVVLNVPDQVDELRLNLRRERLIRVVGHDRKGTRVERHLKITGKGRLLLV